MTNSDRRPGLRLNDSPTAEESSSAAAVGSDTPDIEVVGTNESLTAALDSIPPPEAASDDLEAALDRALARSDSDPGDGEAASPEAAIIILRGEDAGRLFGFRGGKVLIGRASIAQIRLEDPAVSQRHASIERVGTRYYVTDLGSANGTTVNGTPILGATPLRSGDQIEIVDTVLLFRLTGDAASRETHPLERRYGPLATSPMTAAAPYAQLGYPGLIPASPDEERGPSLEEQVQRAMVLFAYARRHWRALCGLPALLGVAGILSVAVLPPPNSAEFLVSLDQTVVENPLEREQGRHTDPTREFFRNAPSSFTEERLVRATLAEVGEPNADENRVKEVAKALVIKETAESVYWGTISDRDGDWATRFLRKHLELYLSREIEKTLRVYQAEVDLLTGRLHELDARLERNEADMRRFREKNVEHLPEFATNRVAAAAAMEGRRGELSANVARLQGELALARQRLARESPLIEAKVREASTYQQALDSANRHLAELRARGYGADHPEVRQATAEVENLQRQVEATTRAAPTELDRTANPEYTRLKDSVAELEVALTGAQAELSAVGGQLGWADEALKKLPGVEADLSRLKRALDTDKELHTRLTERLRQAETQLEIGRATAQARYDIVIPPHTVGVPIRRALALRAAIGMTIGLVLAGLWSVLYELIAIARRLPRVEVVAPAGVGASRALRRP